MDSDVAPGQGWAATGLTSLTEGGTQTASGGQPPEREEVKEIASSKVSPMKETLAGAVIALREQVRLLNGEVGAPIDSVPERKQQESLTPAEEVVRTAVIELQDLQFQLSTIRNVVRELTKVIGVEERT